MPLHGNREELVPNYLQLNCVCGSVVAKNLDRPQTWSTRRLFGTEFKDTGAYEIIEMAYWGFRVVFDGKKGWRPAVLTALKNVSNRHM